MKNLKTLIFYITIFYAVFSFIYISYNDYKFLSRGYHIIDNSRLKTQSIKIGEKVVEYYKYQDYILISENSTNITLDDFKNIVHRFNNIIVAEFSDFGFIFDRYKIYLSDDELKKIRYAHYIKPKEMDKYDTEQVVQRYWRAFNERRINLFYIPEHKNRSEIINAIEKRMKNHKDYILPLENIPEYFDIISAAVLLAFGAIYIPLFSIIYAILYFYFNPWSYVFAAIFFSFISWIKWKNHFEKDKAYIKAVLFNILIGILIYSSGYSYLYIYKISVIRGIKLLLITLPFILFIVQIKNFKLKKKDIILSSIILGIVFIYYILRSGNFGISTMTERKIRDLLEKYLIARPRFKELLGYTFIFTKPPTEFFKIFWNIGQSIVFVSIIDTFLHFQTPLYLGVLRTINAFVIAGIIIVLLRIIVYKLIYNRGE
ncbi:hypothetical protein XO10_05775 [Marinitoga sp. 1135]|uniref:DUF5693 family protein n=1 Tax=unclassified Marinitoga TaxID=2640159 RepID=UPI00095039DE|nr:MULTISPECIES: DUF5693 family protein [unclassified Marinitoga]APT76037.1 hypothetical protein LN42_06310 [Marinitoga sp. 1137]NUU95779.1 hypothetical protein [Marinitoga sp. 1135]